MKNVKKVVYYTIARGSRGAQIYLDKGLFMRDIKNYANPKYKIFSNRIESLCYLRSHGINILEIQPIGLLSYLKKN